MDEVLDALEMLNLRESGALPEQLVRRLAQMGISVPDPRRANVTELIELVWQLQEQFLSSPLPGTDRPRRGPLRGRDRV